MTAELREITLDAHNAQVAFQVRWFGVIVVTGRFGSLHGVLSLPTEGLDDAIVSVDVDAASITTGIGLRDRHLRGPRFLDSARYPSLSFRSTRVARNDGAIFAEGMLRIRDVEQFVIVRCPVRESGRISGDTLLVGGTLALSRERFGIGKPHGILAYSPLFSAIADEIHVDIAVTVPANRAVPALLPALGR